MSSSSTPSVDNRRVFVNNMSYRTRWWSLKDHMKQIGNVAYVDVFTERNGRSKGCGIVEFENPEDAQEAIKKLNESELDGRKIYLREDQREEKGRRGPRPSSREHKVSRNRDAPRERKVSRDRDFPRKRESPATPLTPANAKKVFIGNLSFDFTLDQLKDVFKSAGHIVNAEIPVGPRGRSRGWATIEFSSEEEAQKAIDQFNNKTVGGRTLRVHLDKKSTA
jgi:RNA recognition motif-containing protein